MELSLKDPGKQRLYVHIGLPKTGTKWTQKILGVNREWLDAAGIRYTLPEHEQPDVGDVLTSGNASDLFEATSDVDSILDRCGIEGGKSLFLSSEKIFRNLLDARDGLADLLERDLSRIRSRGFSRIIFLVFVRSPMEQMASLMNQYCKRRAKLDLSDELFEHLGKKQLMESLDTILENLNKQEYVECKVIRYDASGKQLLPMLSSLLGVDQEKFVLPDFARANRSLSYEEIYCLHQLRSSGFEIEQLDKLSRAWMAAIPDLEVKQMYPSVDFQRNFWKRNEQSLQRMNKWLPEDQRFSPQYYEPFTPPTKLELSPVQLDLLVQFLSEHSVRSVS